MGRIKKKITQSLILAIVLLMLGSLLTACAGNEDQPDAQKTVSEKNAGKETDQKAEEKTAKKDADGEIPEELLPGLDGEASGEDADASDEMEIVGKDGTVYAKGSGSADAASGGAASDQGGSSGAGGGSSSSSQQKNAIDIQFSVDSSNADGSVSYASSMSLQSGSTVYQALQASGLRHTGSSYVKEIGGLWEKDFGSQSGWKYYVNGSAPMMSCTDYILQDGDQVQWVYVLSP